MKRLLVVLSSVLILAGCLSGLATSTLYQFEAANKVEVPEVAPAPLQKIDLTNENGDRTVGWYYEFSKEAPLLIYFHGNGSNIQGNYESGLIQKLINLKINFAIFDYPKYGLSTGELNQNTVVGASQDVFDFVTEKFPMSQVIIWGRSLGCAPATIITKNNPKVSKLILTSPWDSFWKLVKFKANLSDSSAKNAAKGNEYETEVHAKEIRIPVLIHHGTEDSVIPWEMGKNVSMAFQSNDVTFVSLEGADHNNLLGNKEWDEISHFIRY